jgi:hypothetical protein
MWFYRLTVRRQKCLLNSNQAANERKNPRWPEGAFIGKPVKFRCGPAAVSGDKPLNSTAPSGGKENGANDPGARRPALDF